MLSVEKVLLFSDLIPHCWNCGMIFLGNQYLFACRYEISSKNTFYYKQKSQKIQRFCPIFMRFNENFNLLSTQQPVLSEQLRLEDVRLFIWNHSLFCAGTKGYKINNTIDQFLAKIIGNTIVFLPLEHNYPLRQKNWVPIPLGNNLYFEMNPANPRKIVKYEFPSIRTIQEDNIEFLPHLRGSCPPIDLDDCFLSFYHYHHKRDYYHIIRLLSKSPPFAILKTSQPFKFSLYNRKIQFLTGACLRGANIVFSYGIEDSDNVVATCSLSSVLGLL